MSRDPKDHPIIFSGPMVLALLGRRKTQTRRALYIQRRAKDGQIVPNSARFLDGARQMPDGSVRQFRYDPPGVPTDFLVGTYWTLSGWHKVKPKDRLWVRENWTHTSSTLEDARASFEDVMSPGSGVYYQASELVPEHFKWRPSIHMPRWASRITINVAASRIERIKDITNEDALAEGVTTVPGIDGMYGVRVRGGYAFTDLSPRQSFRQLWVSINGEPAWDLNPWVVVITAGGVVTEGEEPGNPAPLDCEGE